MYKKLHLVWIWVFFNLSLIGTSFSSIVRAETSLFQPSTNAEELFVQVKMYGDIIRIEEAIKGYTQVIQLNPNLAEAYFERGMIYHFPWRYSGSQSTARKEAQASILDFTQAIRLNPDYAEAYFERGNSYYKLQEYQKSIYDYTQASQIDPSSIKSYCKRGDLYYKLGEKQKAIEDYAQVVWHSSVDLLDREDRKRFPKTESLSGQEFRELLRATSDKDIEYYRSLAYYSQACRGLLYDENLPKTIDDADVLLSNFVRLGLVSITEYEPDKNTTWKISLNPLFSEIYFQKGCDDSGESLEKLKSCSKAIQLYPKSAKAYYERGLLYSKSKKSQKAINEYIQALNIAPELYVPAQKSKQNFIQILRTPPQKAEDYYNRGTIFSYLADYQSAVQDYAQAIRLYPSFAEAYHQRGLAYCRLDRQNAIKDFTQAIKLKPDYAEAYYELGRVCGSTGRGPRDEAYKLYGLTRQKAIQNLTQAIQFRPNYVEAYYERSFAIAPQYCEGYSEEEVRKPEVITAVKDIVQIFRFVGSYAFDNGLNRSFLAIKSIPAESSDELESSSLDLYKRGFSRMETGKLQEAIADFNQIIQSNSADADALYARGSSYYKLKNFKEAIKDLTQALRINPRNADTLLTRALAYYDSGNSQKGVEDTTQAIRVDPRSVGAYFLRGMIQYELGNKEQAYKDFIAASLIWPYRAPCGGSPGISSANPIPYYERGRMLARRGDRQGAFKDLQKAAEIFRHRGNMNRYQETQSLIRQLKR
jgi:tetratricopeptide (TPR) repeat protein